MEEVLKNALRGMGEQVRELSLDLALARAQVTSLQEQLRQSESQGEDAAPEGQPG